MAVLGHHRSERQPKTILSVLQIKCRMTKLFHQNRKSMDENYGQCQ